MPNASEDFERFRKHLDEMKEERDRAKGALEELTKRLKDEEGLKSLQEAQAWLKTVDPKIKSLKEKLDKEMAQIEKEWTEHE